jgi:hypothetical protein
MLSYCAFFINVSAPCQKEIEVLGKGVWGNNPFSKGFSPNNNHKRFVKTAHRRGYALFR